MSKERLEGIRKSLELLELHEVLSFVNEQAEEKVQLEESNQQIINTANVIDERNQHLVERVTELENQLEVTGNELSLVSEENQRYKQALVEIVKEGTLKNFATGNLGYKNGAKIARQALQGGNDNE